MSWRLARLACIKSHKSRLDNPPSPSLDNPFQHPPPLVSAMPFPSFRPKAGLAGPALIWPLLLSAVAVNGLPSSIRPVSSRAAAGTFTHLGCFTDVPQRALTADFKGDDNMTVEMCAAYCAPYQYFGVEYGRECYCGNARDAGSVAAPDAECSFACAGDSTETCGAGMRLDLYVNDAYTTYNPSDNAPAGTPYLGCFVDTGARVLPEHIISTDDMTPAVCAANCAGYAYFGTQWSRECYCGNVAPAEAADPEDCNMPCAGDAAEMCGAGMRLSVYGPAGSVLGNPDKVADFTYGGCYVDAIDARTLTGSTITSPNMTPNTCAAICADYHYFGLEDGDQCFCGMDLDPAAETSETQCQLKCSGDSSLGCGGTLRLTVYKKDAPPAAPSNPSTVGTFLYQSCWTDSVGARALSGPSEIQAGMTVEMCAAFCDGHAYFGVEYANECYCGDERAGEPAPETDCSMLCDGSAYEWCGGPNRMNLYAVDPIAPSPSSTTEEATTIPASTTAEETTSSPASTTPEQTTSEEATFAPSSSSDETISTSASPTSEEATPTPASTTAQEATPAPSSVPDGATSTFASITVETTPPPTITSRPQFTTVTSCVTRLAGGPETSCWSQMPTPCAGLATATSLSSVRMSIMSCVASIKPWPTSWATCFPTTDFASTNTASTIYNCLKTAGLECGYTTDCSTGLFPVGAAPTATPISSAVALNNPGFEKGNLDGWDVYQPMAPFTPQEVSPVRTHSGGQAFRAGYLNDDSRGITLTQPVFITPGANYTVSGWVSHDNPGNLYCRFLVYALPYTARVLLPLGLKTVPAGTWVRYSSTFHTATSYATIYINFSCGVMGAPNSDTGKNTVYVDDISLVQVDSYLT